jgi:predicted transcriptional regulator
MPKTVAVELDESVYHHFRTIAEWDYRTLSNLIQFAVLRYIDQKEYLNEVEMGEIRANQDLNDSIVRGLADAKAERGRYV